MIVFLKSIDNKIWKTVVSGWTHPSITDVEGKDSPKLEEDCTDAEDVASMRNYRALNAIFNGGDKNVFKLISTFMFAKELWGIVEVAFEGTIQGKDV